MMGFFYVVLFLEKKSSPKRLLSETKITEHRM
jgi:hypothetical protein